MIITVAGTGAGAASAMAQVTSGGVAPSPTPVPTPALPVPPAPAIIVPTPTPLASRTPVALAPTPVPRATATPTPRATVSPAARVTPVATPSPTPSSTAAAATIPEVAPTEPAAPSPTPAPAVVTAPASDDGGVIRYWPTALGAIVAILLALAWVLWRRRSVDRLDAVEGVAAERLPRSDVARGRLDMTFRPIRAGLNLLSATSENEIVVTNIGDAVADSIHLHVALVSAHAGQDAEIAALSASPVGRPVVPAFALHPGEQRTLSAVAALPREALRTLTAGGRPMFVPIVAVTLTYVTAGVERRLAQAFAVGVERVDSSKLAPFWLDVPPRSFDQVAARPHAAAVES